MTRRKKGVLLSAAGIGGAVVVWALAFHIDGAARLDGQLLDAFLGLGVPHLGPIDTASVQGLVNPKPFLLAAELLLAAAFILRGPRVTAVLAALLLGATATSQVLKPLLAEPRGWNVDPSAWPSGHSTAALALVLCCLLLVSRSWRPAVAAAGAIFALAVGASILVEGVHFPSDVIGGYLVTGFWTGLAVVALDVVEARRPALAPLASLTRRAALPAAAAGIAVGAVIWRAGDVSHFVVENTKFAVVAAAIALCAAATLAATSRRPLNARFR